uniref:Gnk2-homologous domain-containing protein n=1 Tax=Oryza rufipogon TaxID=4529 RepID=A0A0E0N8G8_ORYRU
MGRAGRRGGSAAVASDLRCSSGDDHAGAGRSAEREGDGRSGGGSCACRTGVPEDRASRGQSWRWRGPERPTGGAARAVAGGRWAGVLQERKGLRRQPPLYCSTAVASNYTTDSQYSLNLNQLLALKNGQCVVNAENNDGFYKASLGTAPDEAFALAMCYADRN